MRAADTPLTIPALDRRRERLLASILTAPENSPARALPLATEDSRRNRVSKWFRAASGHNAFVREGQTAEKIHPWRRSRVEWADSSNVTLAGCHAWTDGSLRRSAGLGFVISKDDTGTGDAIAYGSRSLGSRQVAFDAEVAAIRDAIRGFLEDSTLPSMAVHSDSTSAIAKAKHVGAGPGQTHAVALVSA